MKDGLLIIAPLPTLTIRTRLDRISRIANGHGLPVGLWGWSRSPGDTVEALPFKLSGKSIVLKTNSKSVRIFYPVWSILLFWKALTSPLPPTVYCLGLECAFPIWLASKFRKISYVFDDADRLILILKIAKPIAAIIRRIEIWVSRGSLVHIVPGKERYDYKSKKFHLIKNTPTQGDIDHAMSATLPKKPASFTVLVNGWLAETRGIQPLLNAAEKLVGDKSIGFLVAGRVDGPSAEKLIKLPNVTYLGKVAPKVALNLYRVSDVVATLYDPRIEINQFAESNKWGDAIVMGTPIVVNDEVKTAKFLRDAHASFGVPYSDIDGLCTLLSQLASNPNKLARARGNLSKLRRTVKPFDVAISPIISRFA